MDKQQVDYVRARCAQVRKARHEFFVSVKDGPKPARTMRLIGYMVVRMGFNTVITEQLPNWILGHMAAFAKNEVALDRKRASKARKGKRHG